MSSNKPSLGARLRGLIQRLKPASGRAEFLCDSCRYDWRSACRRPERPNATRCPDYRRR